MDSRTRLTRSALAAAVALVSLRVPALAQGRFVNPASGEALAPGAIVEVRWTSTCESRRGAGPGREIDETELVLSLDGGRTFPVRVTPELSACSTHFLWKVPALASPRARLGLRVGSEENAVGEAIAALSPEFRILPDADGRVEQLRRRAAEWWTPSQTAQLDAEDLLGKTMSTGRASSGRPPSFPEVGVPTPTCALRPGETLASRSIWSARIPSACSGPLVAYTGAPTPLRL